MTAYKSFHLLKVKLKKKNKPYVLLFKASTDGADPPIEIEFCGTEVRSSSLDDDRSYELCQEMNKYFGYGPYDIKKVKETMKEHNHIILFKATPHN